MTIINLIRLKTPICELGESPTWNAKTNEFFWTDILKGIIYAYEPHYEKVRTVLKCNYQIGAFLLAENDTIVLFTEKGILQANLCNGSYIISSEALWKLELSPGERFNDAITDPAGRMISGAKKPENKDGTLYSFAVGEQPKLILSGLSISNGMAFSTDGKTFYHTDSIPATITAYDYDVVTGDISNPHIILQLSNCAEPDGMTVDNANNLWVSCWGKGDILNLSPNGTLLQQINIGVKQCSSLCFGFEALDRLFITTASIGSVSSEEPLGGWCYLLNAHTVGKLEYTPKLK